MIGRGWQQIAEDAQRRLRTSNGAASVVLAPDDAGLPRARVEAPTLVKSARRSIAAEIEHRAFKTCELCGGIGSVRAGPAVTIWCEDCWHDYNKR